MEFKPLSCGLVCGAATGHGPSAFHVGDPNLLSYSGMFQIISAHGLCPFLRNSSSPFFSCCISFWSPLRIQRGHPLLGGGSPTLRVSPDGPRHTASAITYLFLSLHVRATQGVSISEPLVPDGSGTRAASPAPVWTQRESAALTVTESLVPRVLLGGCAPSPPCLSSHTPALELWVPH